MNVDPAVQRTLLDLAATDAELARITHRRRTLPEAQEVERLETERQARKDAAVAVQMQVEDLDRDIRKLEREVEAVRSREDRDRKLLEGGTVTPKQMTELQHELETLTRRQGILEDELLEVMEQREASAADHEHAGAQLSKVEDELNEAARQRDEALADLDTAERRCIEQRAQQLPRFPAELLTVYERQRASRGAGAALLQARRCGACRMELDRSVMARFAAAPPELVLRCEECGAILVRTKESGL
ncbi:C4-type zinc ribbon domain-containing protein [Rhodococcus sp. X156]|uniref:zinc ribbon domain-containing protein n=1 Tax=Rhodococcus sp. X156 TaxID=2499145 RepID=UPI000FD8464F|nr:C4-type zinc ribbon domain-containing protein [Rhodococcus sp. X156]